MKFEHCWECIVFALYYGIESIHWFISEKKKKKKKFNFENLNKF